MSKWGRQAAFHSPIFLQRQSHIWTEQKTELDEAYVEATPVSYQGQDAKQMI